ncbi:hypothetical protein [Aneurinibacillus aneurinilyticus]
MHPGIVTFDDSLMLTSMNQQARDMLDLPKTSGRMTDSKAIYP